jgi:gamma-glutamyltranspeptidase/glutathione hydrolase
MEHYSQSTGTPGTLAGLDYALSRYGIWTFADALAPAIAHARKGVIPDMHFAGAQQNRARLFFNQA